MSDRPETRLDRLVLTAVQARVVALVVVMALVVPLSIIGRLGQGLALAPITFATVMIASVLVAETVARRDAQGRRTAAVEVRRVSDYISRPTLIIAGVTVLVLVGVASWTSAVAVPDDLGRVGRSFAYTCVSSRCDSGAFGPFPGSFYTVPLLIGLVVMVVLAVLTLRVAVRRPRNGSDPVIVDVDEQVRRASVRSVVAAVLLGAAGSLAGVGLYAARGLVTLRADLLPGLQLAGIVLLIVGGLGLVLFCWAIVLLIAPLLDRPRMAVTSLGDQARARR